ncbi:MAG: Inosine-uridine preferring nucleoside hydrolase [Collimonas fungivorans]|uniref:nucleoside hydrolase n=1 Tax=Collimonas fungivorans TaxID=158899 RepID=UPI0026EC0AF9|nr:nucleoside hydrolase [Collimonas fungivorans]MDB5767938.1 Inosine-uridine preferring nucleoside hydrolase [Collimonas fungivorans]
MTKHILEDAAMARRNFLTHGGKLLTGGLLLSALPMGSALAATAAPVPLIIDTDPGADDVIALLLALSARDKLDVRALTTVAGNVQLNYTSRNARMVREWANRPDVPVYAGCARPMLRTPIYAAEVHGTEGVTGVKVFEPKQPLAKGNAVQYLIDTLTAAKPQSMTLVTLGPQTNLAMALIENPGIKQGIKEIVMMGGAHFNGGNITPAAEFNVFADPHASDVVFKSGLPITVIPLDVTHKMLTSPERIDRLRKIGNQAGKIAADILDAYVEHDIKQYGLPGGPVHDATTIGYLLRPELFKGRMANVEVDTREGLTFGATVVDYYRSTKRPENARWITEGDTQGFFDLLTAQLAKLP